MTLVLNWVKSHVLIVLFCAIIVITIPACIFVSAGMNESVSQKISSRVSSTEKSLKKVESTKVEIRPLLPGAKSFDEKMVVTEQVLADYERIRKAIKQDADEIVQEALAINQQGHEEELVPGLLPAPDTLHENDLPYNIHPAYIKAHEGLLGELHAGEPVDEETLSSTIGDFANTYVRTQLGKEQNANLTEKEMDQVRKAMTARRMAEYQQHAADISVYADFSVFGLQKWDSGRKPSPGMWFDWQHEYWVNQDLVRAINKANSSGSESLDSISGTPSSVVKRILKIEILPMFDVRAKKNEDEFGDDQGSVGFTEGGFGMAEGGMSEGGGGKGGGGKYGGGRGGAAPVVNTTISNDDPSVAFKDDFSISITGRTSNALYDVRTVNMSLIVDSNRIPALINAIQTTNFMTVTGCQLHTVNVLGDLDLGYYYGPDPVVQVDLVIETLWLRAWTTKLMPDDVKKALDIAVASDEQGSDGSQSDSKNDRGSRGGGG